MEIVSELVGLEVLFAQVLEIPLAEGDVGSEGDFVAIGVDGHVLPHVPGLPAHLHSLLQKLHELLRCQYFVLHRLAAVDHEFQLAVLALRLTLLLQYRCHLYLYY